jgi:hypothetical protein
MNNAGEMKRRKFGRLTVVQFAGINTHRKKLWRCLCDCGASVVVVGSSLRSGLTKSCGCYRAEYRVTHGKSRNGTPEYRVWAGMLSRCLTSSSSGYHNYGGRGIKVCDRWMSFENFFADMGPRPSPRHSIDRFPDNNGNYEPNNCRWAVKEMQDRNRRTNRLLAHRGEILCLTEWAERKGLHPAVLDWRLRNGWTITESIETPSGAKR